MKKIMFLACATVLVCAACQNGGGNKEKELIDSLTNANTMLKNGYDDLISTINDINAGFSQITAAEDRISNITFEENGELKSDVPTKNIRENMEFIIQILEDNKTKIKQLEDKLGDSNYSSEQLLKMVDALKSQMQDKQKEIQDLKNQLQEKNVQIGKMGERIDQLQVENDSVKTENEAVKTENETVKAENQTVKAENEAVKTENEAVKAENEAVKKENEHKETVLANQDAQINTAYYVFGTKKELKEHKILADGEILSKVDFDKSYFTKIDIRNTTTIRLYSKSVNLLSNHPAGSYSLLKDPAGDITLKINSPVDFWSLTRYLVIKVK